MENTADCDVEISNCASAYSDNVLLESTESNLLFVKEVKSNLDIKNDCVYIIEDNCFSDKEKTTKNFSNSESIVPLPKETFDVSNINAVVNNYLRK